MAGLNKSIVLSFMIVGHTKFTPDSCFGLFKQRFRRSHVQSLSDIATVVLESAKVNQVQLVGTEQGEVMVPTYDWMSFFAPRLRKVLGIKQYHQFEFVAPGTVLCKQYSDSQGTAISLLKDPWSPTPTVVPAIVPPPGLSLERQWYLYEKIRPFCESRYQDITCPLPPSPRPHRTPTVSPAATPPSSPPRRQNPSASPSAKRHRICGKCGGTGHNRRTCNV